MTVGSGTRVFRPEPVAGVLPFRLALGSHKVLFDVSVSAVLPSEIEMLGLKRCLLISTDRSASRFFAAAGDDIRGSIVAEFTGAVPQLREELIERVARIAQTCGIDALLAAGGGSVMDTAKAVAQRILCPLIAIPTNFTGSEVTSCFGPSDAATAVVENPDTLPRIVIYDPLLLATLSSRAAVCSGFVAIANAIEAIASPDTNPLAVAAALAGARHMIRGLRERAAQPGQEADTLCLAGAWLCGEAFAQVGMGLHHRLCHVLSGRFGLPHAEAHGVLLPYWVACQSSRAPEIGRLDDLFPLRSLAAGLRRLAMQLGAPTALQELGFHISDVPEAARMALSSVGNGTTRERLAEVENMLRQATTGDSPPARHGE